MTKGYIEEINQVIKNQDIIKNNSKVSLKCHLSISNCYITKKKEFVFKGKCADCRTAFNIKGTLLVDGKIEDYFIVNVETYDTSTVQHQKKISLTGERRISVKKDLLRQVASEYREDRLSELNNPITEPIDLNTTIVLRKAREEAVNEYINFDQFRGKPIYCKEFVETCHIIRLSKAPFYVIYVSDDDIRFWNKLQELQLDLAVSWDASVGLTKE